MPRWWVFDEALGTRLELSRAQARGDFALSRESESAMSKAIREWHIAASGPDRPVPFPPDFPAPVLHLPEDGPVPDYFRWGIWHFASAKLRRALAQPAHIVSFVPARVRNGSQALHDAGFALMQPLYVQEAIDTEASLGVFVERVSAHTGMPYIDAEELTVARLRTDLAPKAELFFDSAAITTLFASDALAARVQSADCRGVRFLHPAWIGMRDGDVVLRTPDGLRQARWSKDGRSLQLVPIDAETADAGPLLPTR